MCAQIWVNVAFYYQRGILLRRKRRHARSSHMLCTQKNFFSGDDAMMRLLSYQEVF